MIGKHGLAGSMILGAIFGAVIPARLMAETSLAPTSAAMASFHGGTVTFEFDGAALAQAGVRLAARGELSQSPDGEVVAFGISNNSSMAVTSVSPAPEWAGELSASGALLVIVGDSSSAIGNLTIQANANGAWTVSSTLTATGLPEIVFFISSLTWDAAQSELTLAGEVEFSSVWAAAHGIDVPADFVIGRVLVDAVTGVSASPSPRPSEEGGVATSVGPDVIVGDLPAVQRWGRVNDLTAYSAGTTSCNIGTERLGWHSTTNDHPVIGQNMYRLKDGRLEQIGMSWLKHGFYALSGSLCLACTDPTDGSELGVGCSDPYGAGLNGEQSNLGPRYQVNAATGYYPYPFSAPGYPATIGRRMQVHDADIDPDLNPGAIYLIEGHYVTPDDAPQGGDSINNANNNASYRRVTVTESPTNTFNVNTTGQYQTQREKPGIIAWRDLDSTVSIDAIDVPNDGRLILAHKVTDLGNGAWHYEYAVQNLNSDRSATSFSLPMPVGVSISNVGFHSIQDHSGAPYDVGNWTASVASGRLSWAGAPYESNPNANALRWGSLYNFRFDADAPPTEGVITVGLFKPGTPAAMEVPASVPQLALALLASNPPTEAIDARQPSDVDGSNPAGWQVVELTFNGYALGLTPADFTVTQEGGNGPAPTVVGILPVVEDTVAIVLNRSISVGAWTTITHTPSGTSTKLGYLPGDANGDATSSPVDILALIDNLNGVWQPPMPIWQCDANRSGVCEPSDILRVIDLLNGAGIYDAFNGATLP